MNRCRHQVATDAETRKRETTTHYTPPMVLPTTTERIAKGIESESDPVWNPAPNVQELLMAEEHIELYMMIQSAKSRL